MEVNHMKKTLFSFMIFCTVCFFTAVTAPAAESPVAVSAETPALDESSIPLRYLTRPELRAALHGWLMTRGAPEDAQKTLATWDALVENTTREEILIATVALLAEKSPPVDAIYKMCRQREIPFAPHLEPWLLGKELTKVAEPENPVEPAADAEKAPEDKKEAKDAKKEKEKEKKAPAVKYEERLFPRVARDEAQPDAPEQLTRLLADQVRLYFGVSLVRGAFYDEADLVLAGLEPEDVIDPAAMLFYRSVAHHQLLAREGCVKDLEKLQHSLPDADLNPDSPGGEEVAAEPTGAAEVLDMNIPRRYASLVRIMLQDMLALEDAGLDHIARRMEDIRRRLDFGRAGEKVQEVERGVIESLDDIIEKLEEECRKKKSQSQNGGTLRPQKPAEQAQIMGGTGPGQVDRKSIGTKSGWGNLPPKEREESLQQIGKDFPPHYRDAIEQYFRRMADSEN